MQESLERLLRAVHDVDTLLILTHNDPDPDAVASAMALQHLLAETAGVTSRITYQGLIGRAENKALVRYLGHPLRLLTSSDLERSVLVALVDTQPTAGNNALPAHWPAAIVLDHHTWREETAAAAFADVRPQVGATSSMLTEYLQAASLEPAGTLATALFYGIKTDTRGLSRAASPVDTAAYFYLQPRIDVEALAEIEQAQVPASYFKSFDVALRAAQVYDGIVIAYLGLMDYPDLAAEMARYLLRLEKCRWVICLGVYQDLLFLSVRTQSPNDGAELLVQATVEEEGTAGGHGPMAGGQIVLQGKDPEELVQQSIRRALRYLQIPPGARGEPLI